MEWKIQNCLRIVKFIDEDRGFVTTSITRKTSLQIYILLLFKSPPYKCKYTFLYCVDSNLSYEILIGVRHVKLTLFARLHTCGRAPNTSIEGVV